MTQEEKAKAYDEALDRMKHVVIVPKDEKALQALKETIFPELQESNDERIRKSLIKFLIDIKEISESGRTSWAVREDDAEMCKSFLAWLEKQKEQKPFNVCEQCPYYKDCPNYNEQKPAGATINSEPIPTENKSVDIPLAEWSEEDEKIKSCISLALTDVDEQRFNDFGTTLKDCLAWVKSLRPQPKLEWSEEDERMQKEVEKMIVLFT